MTTNTKEKHLYRYWNYLVREGGIIMMVGGAICVWGYFYFHEPLLLLLAGLELGAGFSWLTFYYKTVIEL